MERKDDKVTTRRLRSSYITTIVSISLVLLLLGLMGLLVLNAKMLSDYVKENIGFSVMLKKEAKEVDVLRLQKNLDASPFVKSTKFVSSEDAAAELKKELGEDIISFLGYTPWLSSIDARLHAEYANVDSLKNIEQEMMQNPEVKEVFYQESLVHLVNENVRKISAIIAIFTGLLFLISVALINNTIRLSIYSKRFLIKTMKLVGATEGFIRKPFLLKGAFHGVLGALIAILLLITVVYFVLSELNELVDIQYTSLLFLLVVVLGVLISGISTYFAVNKFLHLRSDELYY